MFFRGSQRGGVAKAALMACALAGLIAAAGCSSGGGQPSWANSLGSGVTIIPPGTSSPGNGSPDGVMMGVITSIQSGHLTGFCKYEEPSLQSQCTAGMSQATAAEAAATVPTFKNVKLGYAAIDGGKGLIGLTGTICVPNGNPKCFTNSDPAAKFDSGKSFTALWNASLKAPANVYALSPVIEISGSWYAYSSN